jgi:hypothetical protein
MIGYDLMSVEFGKMWNEFVIPETPVSRCMEY